MAPTMRLLMKVLGWAMILFAAAGVAVEVDDLRSGKTGDLGAGIAVVVIFGVGGLLLLRAARRMKKLAASGDVVSPAIEQRVLAAAQALGGHVTAVSVASHGTLTIEQARAELERLAKANACLMDVSADGLVVFRFPEFEGGGTKGAA